MKMARSSFQDGGCIPAEHSVDGREPRMPLEFDEVPAGAAPDPNASRRRSDGILNHWVVSNIPADQRRLAETDEELGVEGGTTRGTTTWIGLAPPPGHGPHKYFFTLYAIDTALELPPSAGRAELENARQGHVPEQAVLRGRCQRC
jgi:phosphatidylethanolamine-binding protein (PEBP) family uncharacterized protein